MEYECSGGVCVLKKRPASAGARAKSSQQPLASWGVAGSVAAPLVSGLLASSCCVVQLMLNALSVGCAGFAVLDQWRPLFLALTAILVLRLLLPPASKGSALQARLLVAGISVLLAFSSQLLALHNKGALLPLLLFQRSLEQQAITLAAVTLRVNGMKCEGCASHLRQQLLLQPGVVTAQVDFVARLVVVGLKQDSEDDVARIVAAIQGVDSGYQVEVLGQEPAQAASLALAAGGAGVGGQEDRGDGQPARGEEVLTLAA